MSKENLKELLYKFEDELRCLEQLQSFYEFQLEDDLSLKYIWNVMAENNKNKLFECKTTIEYLQESIKEEKNEKGIQRI